MSEPKVLAPWPSGLRRVPAHECDTETCWEGRAVVADERGDLDVAAGLRGRAFEHAPSPARLDAWVDALLACGATRRARAALELARRDFVGGDVKWASAIDLRLAGLPVAPEHGLFPEPITAALRAAYVAIAEGRSDVAMAAFAAAVDPYHVVHAAGLVWARGEQVQARRLWARARAAYEERGATLGFEPIERSGLEVVWQGEVLVRGEHMWQRGRLEKNVSALRFLTSEGAERRRLMFTRDAGSVAFSADGQSLLRSEDGALVEYDAASGLVLRRLLEGEEEITEFAVSGAGEHMRVLVRRGKDVLLLDARGQQLASEAFRSEDAQVSTLALGGGGQLLALGEPGPEVRVLDLRSGVRHAWTWPWTGAQELDLDERGVAAVGFTSAGDGVVAVDQVGTISRWDLPGGRLRRRIGGRCSRAELRAQGDTSDADTVAECGRVDFAAIAPDGDLVATAGVNGNLRIHDVKTGKLLASRPSSDGYHTELGFSRTGELAVVCDDGQLLRWRRDAAKFSVVHEYSDRPDLMELKAALVERSRLTLLGGPEVVQWDLETGERNALKLAADERSLGVVDEGRRAWVRTPEVVVLRDFRSGAEQLRVSVPRGGDDIHVGQSPPGHALLAVAVAGGWDHHVVGPGGVRVVRLDRLAIRLTADGQRLVVVDKQQPISVWEVATAAKVYALGVGATRVEFAADGSAIAWSSPWEPGAGDGEVRSQRLGEPGPVEHLLEVEREPYDIAISADGSEVLVAISRGLIRWSPQTGEWTEYATDTGVRRVEITGGGATLTLSYRDHHVEVVSNNEHMSALVSVYRQGAEGWLAVGRSGALDGSTDVADNMITRVVRGSETLVLPGRLGWDGARVAGLVPRALAGEDVQAPGIVRAAELEGPPAKRRGAARGP